MAPTQHLLRNHKGNVCVDLGKPLSLSDQMKLNGKENYIMLVSMGRHNIIFLPQWVLGW